MLGLLFWCSASWASHPLRVGLERLDHPQVHAEGVELQLLPAQPDTSARLLLQIRTLNLPALDQRLRELRFECEPAPVTDAEETGPWRCEGPLRWRGGSGWRLAWQADAALTAAVVSLRHDGGELRIHLPLAASALRVEADRAPATWLGLLLPQMHWQGGRIDAQLAHEGSEDGSARWHGQVRTRALAAQTSDGTIAFDGIELAGSLDVRSQVGDRLRILAKPTLQAGELLAGIAYVEWPAGSAVELDVDAEGIDGRWSIRRGSLRDAGFEVAATAELTPGDAIWLRALAADLRIDLERHARYLDGLLAGLGHAGLELSGQVEGRIELSEDARVERFDAALQAVSIRDPRDRYAVRGLDGTLAFRRDRDDQAPVELTWRELSVHALAFSPGQIRARTSFGEYVSEAPIRLGLFGGVIDIRDLVFRPFADRRDRIAASVGLRDIDLAQLSQAFDWPAFSGRLEGQLPDLRYVDEALTAGGEIDIRVFDGQVRVQELAIERPFGIAPALAADVRLQQLDLQPMTEVFGFGRIEGRLDGRIDGLRLIDWRPVAFDARLQTAEQGRRRISQLAVNQLTELGGGGGIGGVQGRLMGVFDSFGYRRIGLACRLHNEVCTMAGLDEAAGGYTILQGSGLPLITIRGFERRVDWPVLVERLRAVAAGQGPEVR